MKATLLLLILFVFSVTDAERIDSESTSVVSESEQTGSIEGTVELATRSRGQRPGGGLYGRPTRSVQSSASSDSVLVILSNMDSQSSTNELIVFLNQKDRKFVPNILPVSKDQTVRILNSDPVYHNVFSLTSPHKFDVGRRPKGEHYDVTFDKPGMVDVFCDIHSNMQAIIYVVPENTITWQKVANGQNFSFDDIPEGNYTLTLVAMGYGEMQESVQVIEGETAQVGTITLNP